MECKTRTNLPINHCDEMSTRTLRSGAGLFAQPLLYLFYVNIYKNILRLVVRKSPTGESTHYFFFMIK
ncbi:hypothetical protein F6O75_03200 [Streptococcus suis]|nr:hypothetical protein B9H01_09185 [Streptococcus suis]AUW22679.1 hypothetical protein BVD85_09015 [Streptococcus suis]AUW24712.1 hypothetical protein CR541_09415 [Streptococcus suis]MBS7848384.1 hypothetical protein [Streptococcus suis]MBS7850417.1 hypothetical protein [Streptococcus suis]